MVLVMMAVVGGLLVVAVENADDARGGKGQYYY